MKDKHKYPKVSIIIINAYLTRWLNMLLKSIEKNTKYPNYEIIIVDCCSNVQELQRLMKLYSYLPLKIVYLNKDVGPAMQHNIGAFKSSKDSKYLVFLDNDVRVFPMWLTELVKRLEEDESIGVAQPLILTHEGIYCGFKIGFGGFPRPIPYKRHTSHSQAINEIFYAQGAAFITRSDLFLKVGMFDGDYFLWYDEVDYCWRVRLAGYRITFSTKSYVIHYGGGTTGKQNPKLWYYLIRNIILTIFKNYELIYAIVAFSFTLIEAMVSYIGYALLVLRDYRKALYVVRGIVRGIRDLKKAFSKKSTIKSIKVISSRNLIKHIDKIMDCELILPLIKFMIRR